MLVLTPELATLEDLFFRLTENGDGSSDGRRGSQERRLTGRRQ